MICNVAMSIKATQHKDVVLFGKLKLTNFNKNQFKVLKKG